MNISIDYFYTIMKLFVAGISIFLQVKDLFFLYSKYYNRKVTVE